MKQKHYQLTASADCLFFTFQSLSVDRIVPKTVQFVKISDKLYNLAFGDLQHDDEFDDLIVTDNKDTELVLATVIQAVLVFLQNHPDCAVYLREILPQELVSIALF